MRSPQDIYNYSLTAYINKSNGKLVIFCLSLFHLLYQLQKFTFKFY